MVAFQAADPGSTPGQRTVLFFFLLPDVDYPATWFLQFDHDQDDKIEQIDRWLVRILLNPVDSIEQSVDEHYKYQITEWFEYRMNMEERENFLHE